MSDFTTWDQAKLNLEYKLREQLIQSFDARPPTTDLQRAELKQAKEQFEEFKVEILRRALAGENLSTGNSSGDFAANSYIESQIMMSHLGKLGKFTGANCDQTSLFISKVKQIRESCPSFTWPRIYGAVKAYINQPVPKFSIALEWILAISSRKYSRLTTEY